MNINLYTGISGFPNYMRTVTSGKTPVSSSHKDGNFDQVSLTRTQTTDDTAFTNVLKKELVSKISMGAGSERVMTLKQQVSDGTYKPDSKRIAERMLGYR